MNKLLLSTLSLALFFTACSKKETTTPTTTTPTTPTIPADGWKLNSTSYKQVATIRQTSQFGIFGIDKTTSPSNFAAFFHNAYPTTSGTFKIVGMIPDSSMSSPGQNLKDGEILIVATVAQSSGPNKSHWSIGTDGKTATVTVTNGKLKIEVPEILVISESNDTGKLTGTILE